MCLASCASDGSIDFAKTLKVTRDVAVNICRVIGAADSALGVLVHPDGSVHAIPRESSGGEQ